MLYNLLIKEICMKRRNYLGITFSGPYGITDTSNAEEEDTLFGLPYELPGHHRKLLKPKTRASSTARVSFFYQSITAKTVFKLRAAVYI